MNEENNNLRKAKGCIPSPEDTRDYNLETVKMVFLRDYLI